MIRQIYGGMDGRTDKECKRQTASLAYDKKGVSFWKVCVTRSSCASVIHTAFRFFQFIFGKYPTVYLENKPASILERIVGSLRNTLFIYLIFLINFKGLLCCF